MIFLLEDLLESKKKRVVYIFIMLYVNMNNLDVMYIVSDMYIYGYMYIRIVYEVFFVFCFILYFDIMCIFY